MLIEYAWNLNALWKSPIHCKQILLLTLWINNQKNKQTNKQREEPDLCSEELHTELHLPLPEVCPALAAVVLNDPQVRVDNHGQESGVAIQPGSNGTKGTENIVSWEPERY